MKAAALHSAFFRYDLTAQAHAQTAAYQQNAEHNRSDYDQIKPDHEDARGRVVGVVGTLSAELSESVADLSFDGARHVRSTVVFRFLGYLFVWQEEERSVSQDWLHVCDSQAGERREWIELNLHNE